ncbi:MAG TPA: efflux RND transporter periplasmic adaptor subunit [Nevskiaceae bacterium]|nr:efflux RND transporter periplasmic adaptor subunit [Nevskiaceae bacterium]
MDWRTRPSDGGAFVDEGKKDRPWLVMVLAVVAVIVLIGGVKACSIMAMMKGMQQPEPHATVTSMKAGFQDWHSSLDAIGSVHPVHGADLSTELSGVVDAINFRSGQDVKAGDVILQLHAATEQAQYDLARTNFERAKAQNTLKLISKADYDAALAQYEAAKATGEKKSVRAPFAGQLGIITVTVGQYVNPGDRMVTLQALDPIYIDFTLPQQALSQIAPGQAVAASVDAYPAVSFSGTIEAIDPKVDERTRNVAVRAAFKNPEHKLLPGMFASVSVDVGQPQRYLTLPQTAVTFNPYGETVYVIVPRGQENAPDPNAPPEARPQPAPPAADKSKPTGDQPPDNTRVARQVFVQVGPKRGDQVAIVKGIREGDEVVTSGQLKLRNGMPVDVDNSVQPTFDPNPTPQEQ